MAQPQGMAPARSTNSMVEKMMSNPLYQTQLREAGAQEGRDNRAVSSQDRTLGKMVAGEQSRTQSLENAGEQLARRRDDLAFQKNINKFEREKFDETKRQSGKRLELGRQQLANYMEHTDSMSGATGLEMALGLLSVGVEGYGSHLSKEQRKIESAENKDFRERYIKAAGSTYTTDKGPAAKGVTPINYDLFHM